MCARRLVGYEHPPTVSDQHRTQSTRRNPWQKGVAGTVRGNKALEPSQKQRVNSYSAGMQRRSSSPAPHSPPPPVVPPPTEGAAASSLSGSLLDLIADLAHILLVLFLVAAALTGKARYINLALVAPVLIHFWPTGACVLGALVAGALLLDHETAKAPTAAAKSRRRSSIMGRRRSLQEPEWLKHAAETLLLPAETISSSAAAVASQAVSPDGAAGAAGGGDDDDAPEWLRQASSHLATTTPAAPRPDKSPPRRSSLRAGASTPGRALSPRVAAIANSGPRMRTRGAASATPAMNSDSPPPRAKTPGSVRWAPDAHSPPPSRAKLHKMVRALNDSEDD